MEQKKVDKKSSNINLLSTQPIISWLKRFNLKHAYVATVLHKTLAPREATLVNNVCMRV